MMNPFRRLRELGIVGMNRRNASYILQYNPRRRYPLVDDKLRTKRLAEAAGIAVPKLLGVITSVRQVDALESMLDGREDFVIKPTKGSGGNGIVVVTARLGEHWRRSSGMPLSREELSYHVSNILSGMHSLGGLPDRVMVEQRVRFDARFDAVSHRGVPDIRTVVYRGVPVMAMMRLPTHASDGKANLHLGGVGVGIDIANGRTTAAIWRNRPVRVHPDTLSHVIGLQVPDWDRLLELAAHCQTLCELGYLGVDLVLDQDYGPLVLELNARPGLSVQLANRAGLESRLNAVDALEKIPHEACARAAIGREIATACA